MLKTIRKTIVGMMNQLRIARSLMPRRNDAAPVAAGCAMRVREVVGAKPEAAARRDVDQGAGEAATPVGGAACSPRGHRGGYLYRPYFLKVAPQSFARFFFASS